MAETTSTRKRSTYWNRTRGVWLTAFAAIVLIGLIGAAYRWLAHEHIDSQTRKVLLTQAKLIEDRVGEHVRGINSILDEVIAETVRFGHCEQRLHERYAARYPEFNSINLVDANGVIRCASKPELVGKASALAEAIKTQPQDGVLVMAPPRVGILGQPIMLYTKAKTDASGRLQMAAMIALNLSTYDQLLDSLRTQDQGIALLHESGAILSRMPNPEKSRLQNVAREGSMFNQYRESGQRFALMRGPGSFDGAERYAALAFVVPRQMQPAPAGKLFISINEKAETVFADWWRQNLVFLGTWSISSLALLVLAFYVARRRMQFDAEIERRRVTAEELSATASELSQQQEALDQHAIFSAADADGRIIAVNDKFCAISGYARDELIGQNHRILNSGTHPPEFFGEMWRTIASGRPWHGLICNRAKDGRHYWVNSTIVPFFDAKGKITRYVSMRTDVTPLVKAQFEIRKSEKNFHTIFDNLQDVFYRTDIEGRLTMLSPSIESLLLYSPPELIGKHLANLWVEPEKRVAFLQAMEKSGGALSDYVVSLRAKDGTIVWVSTNSHYYRDDNGNVAGVEGMVHDITTRKRMNDALVAAKEAAEAANKAKSAFLSNMSHELRTPLNSILGFSQLLQGAGLAPDNREDVDRIYKAGSHLLKLINEILDLAKVEAGKLEISLEPVEVSPLIEEGLDLVHTLAVKHGISLDWKAPTEAIWVHGDRDRLKQAVVNLLSNAIKYNQPHGKVMIRVGAHADKRIRITIRDTGIGLSPEQLRTLFKPFSRLGPKNIEGTGIGLTITRNLVELMGGTIGVDSTPQVGSTFWIELPRDEAIEDKSLPASIPASSSASGTPALAGSVLYIEDNPGNTLLVQKVMKGLPAVRLLTAPEPYEGLELARRHRPNLILLDINLPGIDGFEVLRRLRNDATLLDIPVVAVSANAMTSDIEAGKAAGFDDYLTKPIDVGALLITVERFLGADGKAATAGRTAA